MEKDKFDRWDIPGVAAAFVSLIALFRGQTAAPTVPHGTDGEAPQKTVSGFKAAFSKEDEGIWVSLMASLDVAKQDAITLVLQNLTGVNEVDSFRLAIVNAPNATHTEETRDPHNPKVVVKKVVKAAEYCDEDNRVKLLKNIAERKTGKAVKFVRAHHLAVENPVTKYGPGLVKQITNRISAHKKRDWREILKSVPVSIWIMGGVTALGVIAIAFKIHYH
jgi:hypothetical protein